MSNFKHVGNFMRTFGQEVKNNPEFPNEKIIQLRYNLIKEELDELQQAIEAKVLKEVADALTDILYVTYGAGHSFGIDLDEYPNIFLIFWITILKLYYEKGTSDILSENS